MQEPPDLVTRAGEQLLRWRWPIVVVIGLFNIAVETLDDRLGIFSTLDAFYLSGVVLFGVIGPLLGGVALTVVAHSRRRQQLANRHLSQHKELVALLATIQDWNELTTLIVRYPRKVVDLRGAYLLVYDPVYDHYHLDAQWWDLNETIPANVTSQCTPAPCATCAPGQAAFSAPSFPALCADSGKNPRLGDHYCLPMAYGSLPVALMVLFLSPGISLAGDQIEALSAMAASMAIAIHDLQPQRSAMIRAVAADDERQRIARDLHDTLGQSLGYLRLKLDQLTGQDPLREIHVIRQELEQMRAVAGDAYLQVRRTISDLQPAPPADLEAALQHQGRLAAGRAGFQFDLACEGVPRRLSPQAQRQVHYLLGEALNNVEKHARARHVTAQLAWTNDRLEVRLSDDGRGFDVGAAHADGHFGLGIMQQRALAVDGRLTIASAPGFGTEVFLSLPVASGQLPASQGDKLL